jgi:hypothetical protein
MIYISAMWNLFLTIWSFCCLIDESGKLLMVQFDPQLTIENLVIEYKLYKRRALRQKWNLNLIYIWASPISFTFGIYNDDRRNLLVTTVTEI